MTHSLPPMPKSQSTNTPFAYRSGVLYCEDVSLAAITAAVDTPVYVYSRSDIVSRARAYLDTAAEVTGLSALICYAVKANANPAILSLLCQSGTGADVTSGGELFLALHAGIDPHKIIFSGVGKRPTEIAEALIAGIKAIHVESEMELSAVADVAERLGVVASVGVRVNPNISAETHPYISTGLHAHKFGVPRERAVAMLRLAAGHPNLRPVGLASHIGSQITEIDPFRQAVRFLIELADEMKAEGIVLDYIDAGGGLGIDYESPAPNAADWIRTIGPVVSESGYGFVAEPGRSIVGRSGALLTRIVYTKEQGAKRFVITDAGMTDLIRPTLYQAYHPILPVAESDGEPEIVDIVGPICESSDFLARDRALPPVGPGDLLAILHAGAYGYAMSSNYNGRLRPAEVLVEGNAFRIIRERQTYEALL